MEPAESPSTPKMPFSQAGLKLISEAIESLGQTTEPPTVLSEVVYCGPSEEDLILLRTHDAARRSPKPVVLDDVVQGFRKLGKDLSSSDIITILLRTLAKGETEDLFEWLLWEHFKDDPPADGKGHW